jgi:antitoxin component HigA of HigAB toxin-antitoxin module
MEQSGLTVKDLEPVIGRENRVCEVPQASTYSADD